MNGNQGGDEDGHTGMSVEEFLAHADLTGALSGPERRALSAKLEPVTVLGGEYLMREGDIADALFFVVHGRLGVVAGTGASSHMVGTIAAGAVVGELALLAETPRLASVVALRDTELLRLSKDAFEALMTEHPAALRAITRTVVQRLAERGIAPRAAERTIAVVGLDGAADAAAVADFAMRLVDGLRRYGRVTALDVHRADDRPGALPDALHHAEDENAFVLLTGAMSPAEVEASVRSSDVVLAVITDLTADTTRAASLFSPASGDPMIVPERHLVVLHDDGATPVGADAWATALDTDRVLHLRPGAGDVARVARLLAERSVGVALGGGGARGFAHLGVLRALDEAGIAVDAIGGTSIGAIVAGFYAMGWSADERDERAIEALTRSGSLFGVTLPVLSLSSASRLEALLTDERYFGQRQIEDLLLPYCCVSADLSSAERVVHTRGPLALSVRASASLPGVLPPVAVDGRWLVDGGVLDNLPARSVRDRNGGGPMVAVDIRPKIDVSMSPPIGASVSGWSLVGRRGPSGERTMPSLVDVLVRSNGLGSIRAQQEALAASPVDLLLRPPVTNHRVLDFRHGPALIRRAYEYTITSLESAPKHLWP